MTSAEMKRFLRSNDIERFWSKVEKGEGCWKWLGPHGSNGRPFFWLRFNNVVAYRISYTLCVGDIPKGKELDHVKCDNRGCVNPFHIEPSTHQKNILRSNNACGINARKTLCKRGHPLAKARGKEAEKHGWRECKICYLEQQRLRRAGLPPLPNTSHKVTPI